MEPVEMRKHRLPLDDLTADRLVAGRLDQADAPPGYGPTVSLLAAAATVPEDEIDAGLLAAMVHAIDTSPADVRIPSMRSKLRSAKVATVAAALLLTSAGAAAAATGNLPEPALDALADVAERVGVDLPSSAEDNPGGSDHPTGNVDNPTDRDEHGVEVSEVARNRETTGREHGAAVSEVARAGHGSDAADEDEGEEEGEDETEGTDETERGRPEDPGAQGRSHAPEQAQLGSGNADDSPGSTHRP